MKYDIRTYLNFEMYLWPGVGQLSQVKSVNCVKNFSIAKKSIMHQRINPKSISSIDLCQIYNSHVNYSVLKTSIDNPQNITNNLLKLFILTIHLKTSIHFLLKSIQTCPYIV